MTRGTAAQVMFPENDGHLAFRRGSLGEANELLSRAHYLGRAGAARFVLVGVIGDRLAAAQVWRWPTARHLPSDGTWLELSRWCLTPDAGPNAGSRMHAWAVRWLKAVAPEVQTLVSYSDPAQGHTGALYKACNWRWSPTWHRLKPPPTGNGSWRPGKQQGVKDRWLFQLRATHKTADAAIVSGLQ